METANFRHTAEPNEYSEFQQARNKSEIEFWYAHTPAPDEDYASHIEEVAAKTSLSKPEVRAALLVALMLHKLPSFYALVGSLWHLNMRRLIAIERQVMAVDESLLPEVDAFLTDYFTASVPGQVVPQPETITKHLRSFIASLDPDAASTPTQRSQRKISFRRDSTGTARMSIALPEEEMVEVTKALDAYGNSQDPDALINLVRSKTKYKVSFTVFELDDVLHIHGAGPVLHNQDFWARFTNNTPTTIGNSHTDDYTPTKEIRTLVQALDGTCRAPGCTVNALECDLDHVVNFDEGGPTQPNNLVCLCRFHHNLKTTQRLHYELNEDRSATFYYPNGTTKTSVPHGDVAISAMFSQTWQQRVEARRKHRRSYDPNASTEADKNTMSTPSAAA